MPGLHLVAEDDVELAGVVGVYMGFDVVVDAGEYFGGELGRCERCD